jgi:hypothetical protein
MRALLVKPWRAASAVGLGAAPQIPTGAATTVTDVICQWNDAQLATGSDDTNSDEDSDEDARAVNESAELRRLTRPVNSPALYADGLRTVSCRPALLRRGLVAQLLSNYSIPLRS